MKIKEINYSISGVVPVASYQNLKPFFSATAELQEGDDIEEAFKALRDKLKTMFDAEALNAKAEYIEQMYSRLRFYTLPSGKKVPSVTSVLGWDNFWRITEDELQQYGAIGHIIHKMIEEYIKTGKWIDPVYDEDLKPEVATVYSGNLGLNWEDYSYKAFMEKHYVDFKIEKTEIEVHNEEQLYAGRADAVGLYKGWRSLIDWKSGASRDFRQLAAYAVCFEGIEQMVICPVGKTQNKSGVINPIVEINIPKYYQQFLKARIAFRRRFGV